MCIKLIGTLKTYYQSGKLKQTVLATTDDYQGTSYYETGKLKSNFTTKSSEEYYESGTLKSTNKSKIMKFFDKNGQLKSEIDFNKK